MAKIKQSLQNQEPVSKLKNVLIPLHIDVIKHYKIRALSLAGSAKYTALITADLFNSYSKEVQDAGKKKKQNPKGS